MVFYALRMIFFHAHKHFEGDVHWTIYDILWYALKPECALNYLIQAG